MLKILKHEKILFLFIGSLNTFFSFFTHICFYKLFQDFLDYKMIVFMGTIISVVFNFCSFNFFVYKKFDKLFLRLIRYFISNLISIVVSFLLFIIIYEYIKISYVSALVILALISAIYSYLINKSFIFKNF